MTLEEIVLIADAAYPDSLIWDVWYLSGGKSQKALTVRVGDTLANYIVIELIETYDENAEELDQLDVAVGVLRSAISDLEDVVGALDRAYGEAMACAGPVGEGKSSGVR